MKTNPNALLFEEHRTVRGLFDVLTTADAHSDFGHYPQKLLILKRRHWQGEPFDPEDWNDHFIAFIDFREQQSFYDRLEMLAVRSVFYTERLTFDPDLNAAVKRNAAIVTHYDAKPIILWCPSAEKQSINPSLKSGMEYRVISAFVDGNKRFLLLSTALGTYLLKECEPEGAEWYEAIRNPNDYPYKVVVSGETTSDCLYRRVPVEK